MSESAKSDPSKEESKEESDDEEAAPLSTRDLELEPVSLRDIAAILGPGERAPAAPAPPPAVRKPPPPAAGAKPRSESGTGKDKLPPPRKRLPSRPDKSEDIPLPTSSKRTTINIDDLLSGPTAAPLEPLRLPGLEPSAPTEADARPRPPLKRQPSVPDAEERRKSIPDTEERRKSIPDTEERRKSIPDTEERRRSIPDADAADVPIDDVAPAPDESLVVSATAAPEAPIKLEPVKLDAPAMFEPTTHLEAARERRRAAARPKGPIFVFGALVGLLAIVGIYLLVVKPAPETAASSSASATSTAPAARTSALAVADTGPKTSPTDPPVDATSPETSSKSSARPPTTGVVKGTATLATNTATSTATATTTTAATTSTATTTATTTSKPTSEPTATAGGEFDKNAANAALGGASGSAAGCKQEGDPSGRARVSVTFAPSGRVTQAVVDGPPFAGTATGSCISRVFKKVTVPPFSGGPMTVTKTVSIP
ncbi:MAG: hypothetical protein U0271_13905 [Polyangiaceae bacterium]